MRFEHSVESARPPEDVYAYLANPGNLPDWQDEVGEVRTFLAKRIESTLEVTKGDFERLRRKLEAVA